MSSLKNNWLSYIIYLMIITSTCGCNVPFSSRYQGHFIFYENSNKINKAIPHEQFVLIREDIRSVILKFGFIEKLYISQPDESFYLKMRQATGMYSNYDGSDALVTLAIVNTSYAPFDIILIDRTYSYETDFIIKLKGIIKSDLKRQHGYTEIEFRETTPFLLNN